MNNYIEKDIIENAVIRGRIHLYSYHDAVKLVMLCEQNGLSILGIDSFIVTDSKTKPYMEHSIDFSNKTEDGNTFELARSFLKEKQKYGFVFEVVYEL